VYRFAHEMQILDLMGCLEAHLENVATPGDIFEVINLYKMTSNEPGLNICWQVSGFYTAAHLKILFMKNL